MMKLGLVILSGIILLTMLFGVLPSRLGMSAIGVITLIYLGAIGKTFFNPLYWIWAPWVLAFVPSITGFILYTNPAINIEAVGYILVALVALTVGWFIGGYNKISAVSSAEQYRRVVESVTKNELLISRLAFAGIIGALLFAVEMIFVVGATAEDLFALRQQFANREVSILSRLAPLLVWGSWVALAAVIIGWHKLSLRQRLLWVSSPAFCAVLSLLSAGRQSVFQMLIIICMALMFRYAFGKVREGRGQRLKSKGRRIGFLPRVFVGSAMLAIVGYMGAIAALRNDAQNVSTKTDYLLTVFAAEPDPASREFLERLPQAAEDSIFEATIYFSSGVSLFSGFLEISDLPQFGGQFSFPWVARRFEAINGTKVTELMEFRRELMGGLGYMSHGWSTAFASYILDFGRWGSLGFLLIVGGLAGLAAANYKTNPSFFNLLLVFAANIHFLYMIMIPASSDSVFFFFVVGTVFIVSVLRKPIHPARFRRDASIGR